MPLPTKSPRIILALVLLASTPAFASSTTTFSTSEFDVRLVHNVYSIERHILGKEMPDGATGANVRYEEGTATDWYIEGQRYGGELIQAGVATKDDAMIDDGLRALDWGFKREAADGSFPGTGDPFHSTSLFVEAAARGLILLKAYEPVKYGDVTTADAAKVKLAAEWLTSPTVEAEGKRKNQPYTHRRYLLAAALAEASALTGDVDLLSTARDYVRDGLALQETGGANPEKGGHDASYQALGIVMAERYLLADPGSPLKTQVVAMIDRGLSWESTLISDTGEVDLSGSSRTGVETGHNGKRKTLDYASLEQALVIGSIVTGEDGFASEADKVATAYRQDRDGD